jgi:hypothetical protein
MALLYGRAGRLTTKNGGSRPGPVAHISSSKLLSAVNDNYICATCGVWPDAFTNQCHPSGLGTVCADPSPKHAGASAAAGLLS